TEGSVAHDSAGDNDGTINGEPAWQPAGGKLNGALQFDGVDAYVSTSSVLNPVDGPFSVFAWIKGGASGQVIVSQAGEGGEAWLGSEPASGNLMTALVPPPAGRVVATPLRSGFVITDDAWHHIGFVWDGSRRHLYANGAKVAEDTGPLAALQSSAGGLYIGAGKNLDAPSFFSGLIDDVRIYNLPLSAEEIRELAR
ncbi:MAG: LamG domain-containing protein, partial [Planctomycetota bacterium]